MSAMVMLESVPQRNLFPSILRGAGIGAAGGLVGGALFPAAEVLAQPQILVAQGDSLATFQAVREGEIPDGATVTIEMDLVDLPLIDLAFDAPGIELLFQKAMPDGLQVVDVRGERDARGPFAVVTAVVTPVAASSQPEAFFLAALIPFLSSSLAAIIIRVGLATLVLAGVVLGVRMFVSLFKGIGRGGEKLGELLPFAVAGGGLLVLVVVLVALWRR